MKYLLIFCCALFFGTYASCQNESKSAPCADPAFDQFDFWIGDWTVYTPDGKVAGTNRVEQILGNCVIQENWEGSGGSKGHSFNTYDQRTGEWAQVWVDNGGNTLHFHGKYADGKLAMKGETTGKDGSLVYFKLTFFNNEKEGTVRQLWESSKDKSEWSVIFDGLYKKEEK